MSGLAFVDTNVVVYSRDARDASKQSRAHEWLARLWKEETGRVSGQVLQEYYYTVTQKLKPGMTAGEARSDVRALLPWLVAVQPGPLLDAAWGLQDRHRLSFWDALIVGAAQAGDCRYLLSEDMGDGQELDGLLVVNPFKTAPADLP
jgi:predicted nucleic acid-binding protein